MQKRDSLRRVMASEQARASVAAQTGNMRKRLRQRRTTYQPAALAGKKSVSRHRFRLREHKLPLSGRRQLKGSELGAVVRSDAWTDRTL
jgi:hypothetical protein